MKYTLIGDNNTKNVAETIFKNRGIDNYQEFLNVGKEVCHHYNLLDNIDKAVDCLIYNLDNDNTIEIIEDPDCDGISSFTILYLYIKRICPNAKIQYHIHSGKQHGLDGVKISNNVKLVILPDAGTNDNTIHDQLKSRGIDILVLDHHKLNEGNKLSESAIIVNNQTSNYPNKNLSGAGIVYKFCQALDDALAVNFADDFLDLVATGLIADMMCMKNLENRYLVKAGLNNIKNSFLKALIEQQEFSIKGNINITAISFYIAPLINATIRSGTIQDKIDMTEAFIENNKQVEYLKRGATTPELVSLQKDMARRAYNLRNKQNKGRDKLVEIIENKLKQSNENNKTIILKDIGQDNKNLIGLACNIISKKHKKPTIIINPKSEKEGFYGGSARGYESGDLKSFKNIVENSKIFTLASGHDNSFGVEIAVENIDKIHDTFNKLLENYVIDKGYKIDFIIDGSDMTGNIVFEIGELCDVWGKNIEEPLIYIKNIPLSELDENELFLMGKTKNTICIVYNGIKYILFRTSESEFDNFSVCKNIDIIGKAKIEKYNNFIKPQIFIEDYKLTN